MTDVLLSYVMPVSKTIPIAAPSLLYLQTPLAVVKAKEGAETNTIVRIDNAEALAALTDSTSPMSLVKGGKSYFYAVAVNDLDLENAVIENPSNVEYFTLLIDPAFTDQDVESLTLPQDFKGVVSGCSNDDDFVFTQNKKANYAWFFEAAETEGNNMYKAFGSLLSKKRNRWSSQQYMSMDYSDNITLESTANAMFDNRANFVLTGSQYGNRLALFCVGSESGEANAIVAPYLYEEITVTFQGRALTWIQVNEPDYTVSNAALLQEYLQSYADNQFELGLWPQVSVTVTPTAEQFVMAGEILVAKPSALWRVRANMIEGGLE